MGFFTGFEVGWIAWGVGALTGLGVRPAAQANGEDGPAPGLTAAGLPIAAVLAGKYFVVHLLVDKIMAGPAGQQAPEAVRQIGQEALKQAVFLSSFTLHDILWFCLAAGSAYKLGSGAEEAE